MRCFFLILLPQKHIVPPTTLPYPFVLRSELPFLLLDIFLQLLQRSCGGALSARLLSIKRRVFSDIYGFLFFLDTFPKTSPAVVKTASLNSLKSSSGCRSSSSSLRTSNLLLTCTLYVSFAMGVLRAS